jgi:hypothetical protein
MDAERSADWVRRWVRIYTRGLPADVRRDRLDEIDDDLWCQRRDAVASGRPATSVAGEIVARMVFGIPADLSWRLEQRGAAPNPGSAAPEVSPSMYARVTSAMAMIGGVVWALWLFPAVVLGEAAWVEPAYYVLMVGVAVGSLGLSLATVGLVLGNLDRLKPVAALLGSIGGAAGMLTMGGFYGGGLVALPIGSGVLMLDLARTGVVGTWRARVHAAAGFVSPVPAVILLASNGTTANGIPYVLLIVMVTVWALSWVPIGWSLRGGEWLPEEPAPGA